MLSRNKKIIKMKAEISKRVKFRNSEKKKTKVGTWKRQTRTLLRLMKTKQKTQITQKEEEAMLSASTSVHIKCQKRMEKTTFGNTVKGSRGRRGGSKNIHSWSSEVINDSLWKRLRERLASLSDSRLLQEHSALHYTS